MNKETTKHQQKIYALYATRHTGEFGITYQDDITGVRTLDLPWQTPHTEDMKIFRHLTLHNVVVMGRLTFESLGSKPLPDRVNVVISTDRPNKNVFWARNIVQALDLCATSFPEMDVFFIGGKMLLEELFKNHSSRLDGIYHSVISEQWPDNPKKPVSHEKIYLAPGWATKEWQLESDVVGLSKDIGISVRCSKRGRVRPENVLIDVADCLVLGKPSVFYTPSKSQLDWAARQETINFIGAADVSETAFKKVNEISNQAHPINKTLAVLKHRAEECELDDKMVAAIAAKLNPHTIEQAQIKGVQRDRGMAPVDPFDALSGWREAVQSIESELIAGAQTDSNDASTGAKIPQKSDFVGVATEIGELLVIKDAAYGSAFEKTKEILKILFPNGLPMEAFDDGLTIQRILDKICRLTVLCTNPEQNKTEERTEDAWKDIAGYAIKALCEQRRKNKERNTNQ